MNVILKPKSRRAKNRCTEHGNVFTLKQTDFRNGEKHILVESHNDTWTLKPGVKQHWMGWFSESEAEWETING